MQAATAAAAPERLVVNKRELARRILECSLPTLNELIERYPDFPIERKGSNGVEWEFDADGVVAFLAAKREAEARASDERNTLFAQFKLPIDEVAGEGAAELSPAQRAQLATARLKERKLAVEAGMLVSVAEVRQSLHVALARFGKFLDVLPKQVGTQHNLPEEVQRSMRGRLDDERRRFVAEIQAFLEQDR